MTDARYVIRGGRPGYERLQILARTVRPSTAALLDRVGLRDGLRCCDLGCGPGEVSFMLADRVAPTGRVDAFDMDEVKLELARAEASARGIANVAFHVADVTAWDAPGAYDVVYARFLLQHLRQPGELVARMWAAVRPGGALILEDADFALAFCEPPDADFDFFIDAYSETLRRRGGDPSIGRRLHRCATDAGVPEPELSIAQHVEAAGEGKTMMWRTLEATADAMVAEGVATDTQIAEALEGLIAATDDPGTVIGGPATFQVWARKPAGRSDSS
jgi:ubiquinone/menaquinone biosynthesis C-methylase UbiE